MNQATIIYLKDTMSVKKKPRGIDDLIVGYVVLFGSKICKLIFRKLTLPG